MFGDDWLEEARKVGRVGARVEGSVAGEQQFKRRQECDIELETVGAGSPDRVEREDIGLGADGEVDGADRESRLTPEEGDAGAAALAIAVPEDADHAALTQGAQRPGDSGLSRREELDACSSARRVDGLEVSRIIESFDQGDRRDVERCERLNRDLGIRDVGRGQDDAASGFVSVEEVVQALDVEVSVEDSLRAERWQDGEVDVVARSLGDDLCGIAVELRGGVLRVDALEVVADANALPLEQRDGEGGDRLSDGVEGASRQVSGEPGEGGEGSGGRHVGIFARTASTCRPIENTVAD